MAATQSQAKPPVGAPTGPADRDEARNEARPILPARWREWNDRHKGEDVYLIGASPQLAQLTEAQLEALRAKVVIGGNNTFYKVPLTYFLSAYQMEVFKAALYMPEDRLVHIKRFEEDPLSDEITSPSRLIYEPDVGLPRYLTDPGPVVYTSRNQVLAMLHLTMIMGARRAIFVGVDQTNYAYFWQHEEALRTKLRRDLHKLQSRRRELAGADAYFEQLYKLVTEPLEAREQMAFYEDFTARFADYIEQARGYGTEVVATLEGSVIHNAGGTLSSLDDCLRGPADQPLPSAPSRPSRVLVTPRPAEAPDAPPPGVVAPILISGLPEARAHVAAILRENGVPIGKVSVWGELGAQTLDSWLPRSPLARIRSREPLFDYPEPLVEFIGGHATGLQWAVGTLTGAFSGAELVQDLLGSAPEKPESTLWTLRSPWGWESAFDISVLRALEHVFPGIQMVHVQAADPEAQARRLVEDFATKVAKLHHVEFDGDPATIRIHGQAPRQMHVLREHDRKGPLARFTLRCAGVEGARDVVRAYDRMGCTAAFRLGERRAVMVTDRDVIDHPESTRDKLMRMLGA